MASKPINSKEAERQENLENTLSRTEQFFNENGKLIWSILAAIVVVGLAVLGYHKYIYNPKCQEAQMQAVAAENAFAAGEYELALNGDGNDLGFAQIIEDYGTKAGKAVYLYAGICELQLGNSENAIAWLKKYNGKEPILAARAAACLGDAYVNVEDYQAAVRAYKKAIATADNQYAASYLYKEGLVYEKLGDKAAALACYKQIKDKYPQSVEGYDIEKSIAALED